MRLLLGFFSLILLALPAAPFAAGGDGGAAFLVQRAGSPAPAPGFTLPDLEGRQRSLEEFAGRVVLLHFWASWCEPCKREFPAIERLSALYKDRGLAVVAVAEDSAGRAGAFALERGFSSTVLIDRWGKVMRDYGVMAIPVSVVIGRHGAVLGVINGERDYSSPEAAGYFERVLSER